MRGGEIHIDNEVADRDYQNELQSDLRDEALCDISHWLGFGDDWDEYVDILAIEKEKIFKRGI